MCVGGGGGGGGGGALMVLRFMVYGFLRVGFGVWSLVFFEV